MTEIYCIKCRRKKKVEHLKKVNLKNGAKAVSGICKTCGTRCYKIGR